MGLNLKNTMFAGQFYEKNSAKLKTFIDNCVLDYDRKTVPAGAAVRSVINPHAGYVYSGSTAIKTLSSASDSSYDNIFVVTPSHCVGFSNIAVSSFDEYATPLGNLRVNTGLVEDIQSELIVKNDSAHMQEHSLEVQLPIIKALFEDVNIVPMVCGQLTYENIVKTADQLKPYWSKNNLWVISSDFTHYGRNFGYLPFNENIKSNLEKLDRRAIENILDFNPQLLYNYLNSTGATVCGKIPILLMLNMIKSSGEENILKAKLVEYITSGDLTGDFSHCVSYAGITIFNNN